MNYFHRFLEDVVLNQSFLSHLVPSKLRVKAWTPTYSYPHVDLLNTAHHSAAVDDVSFIGGCLALRLYEDVGTQ